MPDLLQLRLVEMQRSLTGLGIVTACLLTLARPPFPLSAVDRTEVTVVLFSLLHPQDLLIQCSGGELRTASGAVCQFNRQLAVIRRGRRLELELDGQRHIEAGSGQVEIRSSDGRFQVTITGIAQRCLAGRLKVSAGRGALRIINALSLDEYLVGVITNEIAPEPELLKCQAILSRTFALKNRHRHWRQKADFCDTTHCQLYRGCPANPLAPGRAIAETASLALCYRGQLGHAYFHSTCGGFTTSADSWHRPSPLYLNGVNDRDHCAASPHFRWSWRIEEKKLQTVIRQLFGVEVIDLRITRRDHAGWIKELTVVQAGGKRIPLGGEEFRHRLGKKLGWNAIRSANFILKKKDGWWHFQGRGLGHGIGLCQWGAAELARRGWTCAAILEFYFPGSEITASWAATVAEP